MNRREMLAAAAGIAVTVKNPAYVFAETGMPEGHYLYEQKLHAPPAATHTLEVIKPDGKKEVLTQQGSGIHPQLVKYLHKKLDEMTDTFRGSVTTKIIHNGPVTRIEIEQVTVCSISSSESSISSGKGSI